MEKLPAKKFERKSGVVRVAGVEEDKELEILEVFGELFDEKQEFKKGEIEKTPEQKEVVVFINQKLPEFIRRYGGEPLIISEDKIHLLPGKYFPREDIGAVYYPAEQSVYVRSLKDRPLLAFAKSLTHEELHWNSFQSMQFGKQNKVRRMGFKIIKGKEKGTAYFSSLDEAMTEELTKRFSDEFLKQVPVLKEDFEILEALKRHRVEIVTQTGLDPNTIEEMVSNIAFVTPAQTEDRVEEAILHSYSYAADRAKLNNLIAELYEKNKNDFQSREEVFALFARAVLSGRLLPVARLIEKTYGKGSFRRVGEQFGGKLEKI